MEYKKIGDGFALRLDKKDEIIEAINKIAKDESIKFASISGIGALDFCEIGVFDTTKKTYDSHVFEGTHEITNLSGNITTMNGDTYLHIHITLAGKNGIAYGGHLLKGIISVTGEIFINVYDVNVDREHDDDINVNKWKL